GLHLLFSRTRFGLYLRSVGENPKAADLFGVSVDGVRYGALALGGGLIGMAGAYLSLAYRPSWTDGMTSGLGWVAIAL
ncbi:ABC transporter permease, partial [Acinetobacter baumannii]